MTSVSTVVPLNSQIQTITFTTMIPTVTTGNVRVGTLSFSGSMPRGVLPNHEGHQCLLCMQTVLGLVPHRGLPPVENFLGDLFAVMGGKAVQDDRACAGPLHEVLVDAEARKVFEPLLTFLFLAHRRPDVC